MVIGACQVSMPTRNKGRFDNSSPFWGVKGDDEDGPTLGKAKRETGYGNTLSQAFLAINSAPLLCFERECDPLEDLGFPLPTPPLGEREEGEKMNRGPGGYRGGGRFNRGEEIVSSIEGRKRT